MRQSRLSAFFRLHKKDVIGFGVYYGIVGAAVAAVSSKVMNSGHKKASHMRKSAGKAMHSVGNLIGDVEKMLR